MNNIDFEASNVNTVLHFRNVDAFKHFQTSYVQDIARGCCESQLIRITFPLYGKVLRMRDLEFNINQH